MTSPAAPSLRLAVSALALVVAMPALAQTEDGLAAAAAAVEEAMTGAPVSIRLDGDETAMEAADAADADAADAASGPTDAATDAAGAMAAEAEATATAAADAARRAAEAEAAEIEAAAAEARAAAEAMPSGPDAATRAAEATARVEAAVEAARLDAEAAAARLSAEVATAREAADAELARLAAEAEAEAAAQAALAACMDTAGAPSAEIAETEAAQRAIFQALAAAQADCVAASEALPEEGGPLFHLATIAQVTGNQRQAVRLYERAAEAGVGAAYSRLGDYYLLGIRPIDEDVDEAVRYYREAVALGDPEAMVTLAQMHRLGRGVPRDGDAMLELLQQATEMGYHRARSTLLDIYLTGEGVPEGTSRDLPDARPAIPILAGQARAGDVAAALRLAQIYGDGAPGVPANPPSRYRWVSFVAESGDPQAIAARAFLLERGIGVARDPQTAAELYVEALETGEVAPEAMRGTVNGFTPAWDRETALAFQAILQERGLYEGPLDAIVGPGTLAGARALAAE